MFPTAISSGQIKLKRKIVKKITRILDLDRKCGLYLTDTGKIFVVRAKYLKFSNFNFQNEKILQKATQVRMGNDKNGMSRKIAYS